MKKTSVAMCGIVASLTTAILLPQGPAGAATLQPGKTAAFPRSTARDPQARKASGAVLELYYSKKWRCLEVPGYSKKRGAGLDAWGCHARQRNEQWALKTIGASGYVMIQNVNSGLCMNVPQHSKRQGTRIVQWPCNKKDRNSQWSWAPFTGGRWYKNKDSGLCLSVAGASTKNGAWLVQWGCSRKYLNERIYYGG
ncbi:RICIN domain-containing protein [Actinoallomurus sp. CA-150999]|uniref:RICIN domain-containing protein n=1 Tax=Actinoallomurus sp. CA-150999 TaxID=3239887 RepID=UPI003D92E139